MRKILLILLTISSLISYTQTITLELTDIHSGGDTLTGYYRDLTPDEISGYDYVKIKSKRNGINKWVMFSHEPSGLTKRKSNLFAKLKLDSVSKCHNIMIETFKVDYRDDVIITTRFNIDSQNCIITFFNIKLNTFMVLNYNKIND